jgi:hypothetical protein
LYAEKFIKESFKLNGKIRYFVCDGMDLLNEASTSDSIVSDVKNSIDTNLDINENIRIVFVIRRFQKGWGIDLITDTLLEISEECSNLRFILISGTFDFGNSDYIKRLKSLIDKKIIWLIDSDVSESFYIGLIKCAEVGVSVMDSGDMRSGSILLAAKYQLPLVMNKSSEFEMLEEFGFRALYLENLDSASMKQAIYNGLNDEKLRSTIVQSNLDLMGYLKENGNTLTSVFVEINHEL